MELKLLSAGAAQAVVVTLAATLEAETGVRVKGTFGAVGAMRDKLLADEPCDLIILTHAQIGELAVAGRILEGSAADLGSVRTGVAVCEGDPLPNVSTEAGLRAALLEADGIYFPDPLKATAGIHFAKVIDTLGIRDAVAARLRAYANGATAMRAMVEEKALAANSRPIGCTQITEINNTPGAVLVGALPKQFELATTYTIGVSVDATSTAASIALAKRFAELLTGTRSRAMRLKAGFEFASGA